MISWDGILGWPQNVYTYICCIQELYTLALNQPIQLTFSVISEFLVPSVCIAHCDQTHVTPVLEGWNLSAIHHQNSHETHCSNTKIM